MTGQPTAPGYAFGDSDAAAERLAYLAELFAPSSRLLLRSLVERPIGVAIDLGCGPGHTTGLLASELHPAQVIGLDCSESFLPLARGSGLDAQWLLHDVTVMPFPVAPAELIYARLVLAHLAGADQVLSDWITQLAPGGYLVLEEDEDIVTDLAVFDRLPA